MILVLAPFNLHRSILNEYRKDDPFCDIKLVTKEELNRHYFESYKVDAVLYLMREHHFSYQVSRMYLEYLPFINDDNANEKLKFLLDIKKELLDAGLIFQVEDKFNIYKNKEFKIVGYSSFDRELIDVLNKLNDKYEFVLPKEVPFSNTVKVFDKVENEIYYALNEIATLIDKGVSLRDIFILRRNNLYDYYLKKFADSFGYQLNIENTDTYSSLGAFKEFKKLYEENKDVDKSLEELEVIMKEDELFVDLKDMVLEYKVDGYDYEIQKDYLYSSLKSTRLKQARYDNAIEVISEPIYGEGKHIFAIGFAQGLFPKTIKDDGYLDGNELHAIGRNNAKDKTRIDNDLLTKFFKSKNNFTFTFAGNSIQGSYYLSPICRVLDIKEEKIKIKDEYYSKKVLTYIYSNLKDLETFYRERGEEFYKIKDVIDIEYNSYDNSYKNKVNAYNKNDDLFLSTSQLDQYSRCPFNYYLARIANIDENETSFAQSLGNIAHHIFQHQREDNFDFNQVFDQQIANFNGSASELFLLKNKLKGQIETASKSIALREKYYRNPKIYNEIELETKIEDHTTIKGKIDNLVVLDDKYLICIDYKTGSTSSDFKEDKLQYGLSTQLPTYTLLTKYDDRFADYLVSGIYINHVITDAINVEMKENALIYDYLKLCGKTINDLDIISHIDSTIADNSSSFINGIALKGDGSFHAKSPVISEEKFEEYKTTVENLFLEMANNIRHNNFEIKPIYFNENDNACRFCDFKDVCFVKPSQRKVIVKEEKEDEQ